jgi:branched-chain amino acid transport system substrate-binding protein
VLVSSAPRPSSTPELRRFEQRFEEQYGRAPGPYAAVGYEAMRSMLDAIARAGDRASERQAVIDAYLNRPPRRGTLLGSYRIDAGGKAQPARFSTFRAGPRGALR